jgi:phytoene dehydrogenase-like protein
VSSSYDVIVVGAGPGGATCGALLAKEGLRVLLLDKNAQVGGKSMTVSRKGFRYEYWPIYGVPAAGSQVEVLLRKLGLEKEVELLLPDPMGVMNYGDSSGRVRSLVTPGAGRAADMQETFNFLGVGEKDAPEAIRLFTDMLTMGPLELDALDDVTVQELLARYQIPRPMYSFLVSFMCEGTMETPADVACASEFVRIFRDSQRGGGGRYVAGGLGTLYEAEARLIESCGGDVLLKTRVERILVKNGRVTGVLTAEGAFYAPIVVSDAGIQPTVLKLVGEEHFDKSYFNYITALVPGWACAGARYFLSKPVLKHPCYVYFSDESVLTTERMRKAQEGRIPEETYIYVGTNSVFPGMAPEGKQLVWTALTCPSDPKTNVKPWMDALEKAVGRIWPEILNNVESKEYYGPAQVSALSRDSVVPGQGGDCFGLAQTVGQCGRHKPSPKAPINGLYFVGFDVGTYGLGTHCVVDTAMKVADMVRQYSATHRGLIEGDVVHA